MNRRQQIKVLQLALSFYADESRYLGPNQRLGAPDPFQPADLPYRLDVTRDGGAIARAGLANTVTAPVFEALAAAEQAGRDACGGECVAYRPGCGCNNCYSHEVTLERGKYQPGDKVDGYGS